MPDIREETRDKERRTVVEGRVPDKQREGGGKKTEGGVV
jgi:hypothetical protein